MSNTNLPRDLENDNRDIIDKYEIFLNKSIIADNEICRKIISLNFKISNIDPLVIESEAYPGKENLNELTTFLRKAVGEKKYEESKKQGKVQEQDSTSSSNDPCTSDSWERVEDDLVIAFNRTVCLTDSGDAERNRSSFRHEINNSNTNIDSLNSQIIDVHKESSSISGKVFPQQEVDGDPATLEHHENALKSTKRFSEVKTRDNSQTDKKSFLDRNRMLSNENFTSSGRNADESLNYEGTLTDQHLSLKTDVNTNKTKEDKKNVVHNAACHTVSQKHTSCNYTENKLGPYKEEGNFEQQGKSKMAHSSQYKSEQLDRKYNGRNTVKEDTKREQNNHSELDFSKGIKKIGDTAVENLLPNKQKAHSKGDDSEIKAITSMVINKKIFRAAKIFYKKTDYYSFIKSAAGDGNDYEINFLSEDRKANEFRSMLEDFQICELDGNEKTEVIINYVKRYFPEIRAICFEDNVVTLMGQKAELKAAKNKILFSMGINDEDPTETTHTVSGNTVHKDNLKVIQSLELAECQGEKESKIRKTQSGKKQSAYVDIVSEDSGSEKEDTTSIIMLKENFTAAQLYYKSSSYFSYLSVVDIDKSKVKIKAGNKKAQSFLCFLKDFETFEINAQEKSKDIISLLRNKFPETINVCLNGNVLLVMGQKGDVETAKTEISFLLNENSDDEENFGDKASEVKKLLSLENSGQDYNQSRRKASEELDGKIHKPADKAPSRSDDVEMKSDNSDSEKEKITTTTIPKKIFQAANLFYKDPKHIAFLSSGVEQKNCYIFKSSYTNLTAQEFLNKLNDFKIFEIDGKEKTKTIVRCIEKQFPATKVVCFQGNILTLMGQKSDLQAAKSKILSLMGNNDEDTTWSAHQVVEKAYQSESDNLEDNQSTSREHVSNRQASETGARAKENKVVHDQNRYESDTINSNKNRTEDRYIEMFGNNAPIFIGCSKLKVVILKRNITLEKVDCIVNAATPTLKQKGGVGGAIARAAGLSMQQECDSYIKEQKYIPVTEIFVSGPGHLSGKKIIHAVGPKWDDYSEKHKCDDDLRRTILRCLLSASKMKMSSIALPAVSSAGFKVPSNHCAYSYLNAVKHFDVMTKELSLFPLQEIRFIDINEEMVKTIIDFFKNYWKKDLDDHIYKSDLEFAKSHLKADDSKSTSKFETQTRAGSRSRIVSKQRQIVREYTKGHVKFCLSTKHAFDFKADLVVVIGRPFRKLSGLSKFDISDLKSSPIKKSTKQVEFLISQPSSKAALKICKLNIENESKEEMHKAFRNLKSVIDIKSSVVVTSSLLYPEENDGFKPDSQLVKTFCLLTYTSVMENLRDLILLKYVTVTASEEIMPEMIKCMDLELGLSEKNEQHSPKDERKFSSSTYWPTKSSTKGGAVSHEKEEEGTSVDQSKCCDICYHERSTLIILSCCHKRVCSACNQQLPSCPYCRVSFGRITGTQPDGSMSVLKMSLSAAGYEHAGSWLITYKFPSGYQKGHHPKPGFPYPSCERKAYLPDISEGFEILKLLRLAFIRRLTFTIGKSMTTNKENVITWNDIHHKTRLQGGDYGFPDSSYFKRVKEELKVKGVNLEEMSTEEKEAIDDFARQCRDKNSFNLSHTTI